MQGLMRHTMNELESELDELSVPYSDDAKKRELCALLLEARGAEYRRKWYDSINVKVTILVAVIGAIYAFYDRHMAPSPRDLCIDAIAAATCGLDEEQQKLYVHRHSFVEEIDAFLRRNVREQPGYMVIIGPRGCGKSTLVLDALKGHKGVIVKRFGSESDTKQMFETLLSSFLTESFRVKEESEVQELFLDVQRKHFPENPAWRPTIVAEVDRGITDDVIVEVSKAMKRLGADLGAAHVILVLSDANAAFALPDDPSRQEILWVEDLEENEAHTLLDRFKFFVRDLHKNGSVVVGNANADLRSRIFNSIGTRAADLVATVTKSTKAAQDKDSAIE